MQVKIKKITSLFLALILAIGIFAAVPIVASAADEAPNLQTIIDEYGRNRGIPMPDGMIVNQEKFVDPEDPDWNGYYKIYYFDAPKDWIENKVQYKNEGFEIGFYWYQGETSNGAWPGEAAKSLADFKIDYFKRMNPTATEEEITAETAKIEAQFGTVYYAICKSYVPFIIWNNGINGGLPTDYDFNLDKASAARQTTDINLEDSYYNYLGSPNEVPDEIYNSKVYANDPIYNGNYPTGVTDLCGCISYVTGETFVENPFTGITYTVASVNWKFYDPKSGAMTNQGLVDENGELIYHEIDSFDEAQNPYYDMDYSYVPTIEFPEEKPTEPETDPIYPQDYDYTVLDNGTLEITGYNGSDTEIVIPSEIDGKAVTSIDIWAFEGCTGLTSVTIPESVTSIGSGAFYGCSGLASITIPDSVTSIGAWAFYNTAWYNNQPDGVAYAGKVAYGYKGKMPDNTKIDFKDGTLGFADSAFLNSKGLTSVTIPDSVTSIAYGAFGKCTDLANITIPDSVTSIKGGAFENCSSLTSFTIPDSVISIEYGAFENCTGLASITIGNGVTNIGDSAFSGCTSLASITIPDGVTSIGKYAFSVCTGLTSIIIPNSIKYICDGAFYNSGLTSVTIPNSVTHIGKGTFEECTELKKVKLSESMTAISEWTFWNCTALSAVTIPDSVKKIGYRAFDNCKSLTNIVFPDSITSIGPLAFSLCSGLTSITLPESVTSIGADAFAGCTSLSNVTIPESVTEIDEYAFGYDIDYIAGELKLDNFTITGYTGTAAEQYAKDNGFTFIALEPEAVPGDINGDGEVTLTDSINIQKAALSMKELSGQALKNADLNGDGKTTVFDAIIAQKIALQIAV